MNEVVSAIRMVTKKTKAKFDNDASFHTLESEHDASIRDSDSAPEEHSATFQKLSEKKDRVFNERDIDSGS